MHEKLTMIEPPSELDPLLRRTREDPSFHLDQALQAILAREPDNANVVLTVDDERIMSTFMRALVAMEG